MMKNIILIFFLTLSSGFLYGTDTAMNEDVLASIIKTNSDFYSELLCKKNYVLEDGPYISKNLCLRDGQLSNVNRDQFSPLRTSENKSETGKIN